MDEWPQFECNFNVFADNILPCSQSHNLSTALPARGYQALQRVIGWELSCTYIVTSWSQRRRPKHGGLADRWGSTYHVYGRKFAIKIKCHWDERYVNLKMKIKRFSAGKILLEIVPPLSYKAWVPQTALLPGFLILVLVNQCCQIRSFIKSLLRYMEVTVL